MMLTWPFTATALGTWAALAFGLWLVLAALLRVARIRGAVGLAAAASWLLARLVLVHAAAIVPWTLFPH